MKKPAAHMIKKHVRTARGRPVASTLWLQRQLNDPYVALAKKEGYRARSAFKLIELDDKFGFLKPGKCVVDLGAAPGGWTQIAVERVKSTPENPTVVGLDLLEMDALPGAKTTQLDFLDDTAPDVLKEMLGGMGINSIEALKGNRLMLRGVGMTEKELSILGILHAGE